MDGRTAPRIGMSYVDANPGRVVNIEDDVLSIKSRIEEQWPELEVYLDKGDKYHPDPQWIIVENCKDGQQRLVLTTQALNQALFDRLFQADQSIEGHDVVDLVDKLNAKAERDQERRFEDAIGEANERLLHALRKDGIVDKRVHYVP